MAATALFSSMDLINTQPRMEGENFTAIFGSMHIDLTRRQLAPGDHTLNLMAMFGSIVVRVPDKLGLRVENGVLMGQSGFDWRTADDQPLERSQAPEVEFETAPVRLRIMGTAIFGSVTIVRVAMTDAAGLDEPFRELPESFDQPRAYEGETRRIGME